VGDDHYAAGGQDHMPALPDSLCDAPFARDRDLVGRRNLPTAGDRQHDEPVVHGGRRRRRFDCRGRRGIPRRVQHGRQLCGRNSAAFDEFYSAYVFGSSISLLILAVHATRFVLARGCQRWWSAMCESSRHPVVSFVAILCLVSAYTADSAVLHATAVYLLVVSAMYKAVRSIHGERHAARFVLRYRNFDENEEVLSLQVSSSSPPNPPCTEPPNEAAMQSNAVRTRPPRRKRPVTPVSFAAATSGAGLSA
jgi:hypothetical protein